MNNTQIIFNESIRLMNEGIIGTTGRVFTFTDADGNTREIKEPEPLHTFQGWKERGYIVRKGQHATAEIYIWKYGKSRKAKKEETDPEAPEKGKCFWKKAFFFTFSQVEKIEKK